MESWVLLMLGLAVATTALPPALEEQLSYEEVISEVIDFYNEEAGEPLAFRLLEAQPQLKWDPLLQSPVDLEFTMQETTCPPSEELDTDDCDFKDNGVVKECSGTIFPEEEEIELNCETTDKGDSRVRRGAFKKFRQKVKKAFKKFLHLHD